MHNGKVFLRIFISCLLLLVFLFKLTSTAFELKKISKNNVALVGNNNEGQEDPEKKNELKSAFNFNKEFDRPAESFYNVSLYLIISNLHPDYVIAFFADHHPTVPTPPPNC